MIPDRLTKEICYNCRKKIFVAAYEPNSKAKEVTGYHLSYLEEDGHSEHLGWLCLECANKYEKIKPNLNVMFGFSGQDCPPDISIWHKTNVSQLTQLSEVSK